VKIPQATDGLETFYENTFKTIFHFPSPIGNIENIVLEIARWLGINFP
jgi:hypothetical protein